jgi:WD40 repeat protein
MVAIAHMPERQTSANIVRVRDARGKELFRVPAGLGGTSILGFSPDSSTVVAGSWDADVRIWSARNGELVKLIDSLPVAMFAMSFSPDGTRLATAGVDRTVYLWNTKDWSLEKKLTGQREIISALAFSPDGRRLVTGGFDPAAVANPVQLIIWDIATAQPLRTESMPHAVRELAFSPDGHQVASYSTQDRFVRVWQAPE